MSEKVILECVVGSTLHGTAVQDGLEDLDLMAVAIESPRQRVGFFAKDTWVTRTKPDGVRSEAGDVDSSCYGLRKFLGLVLSGNPTILLPLFAPEEFLRVCTPEGEELRALAPKVVSRRALGPFLGYMQQQHRRLLGTVGQKRVTRPELVEKFGFDTKYAAHVVRLGMQGEELLRTGRITLPMPEGQRRTVLGVRGGHFKLEEVSSLISAWELTLKQAGEESALPEEPDVEAVEAWMIGAYLRHWGAA